MSDHTLSIFLAGVIIIITLLNILSMTYWRRALRAAQETRDNWRDKYYALKAEVDQNARTNRES